jgi:hypothetical protein
MAFEHHPVDHRRVAGGKLRRNPIPATEPVPELFIDQNDPSMKLFAKLRRPFFYNCPIRFTVHGDVCRCRCCRRKNDRQRCHSVSERPVHRSP